MPFVETPKTHETHHPGTQKWRTEKIEARLRNSSTSGGDTYLSGKSYYLQMICSVSLASKCLKPTSSFEEVNIPREDRLKIYNNIPIALLLALSPNAEVFFTHHLRRASAFPQHPISTWKASVARISGWDNVCKEQLALPKKTEVVNGRNSDSKQTLLGSIETMHQNGKIRLLGNARFAIIIVGKHQNRNTLLCKRC